MKVSFIDLSRESRIIGKEINKTFQCAINECKFILGHRGRVFENDFADYLGVKYCVGCASGTDAITLALRALALQPGDEVLTQTNTCVPTVCGIVNSGARPAFCDIIEESAMMNPDDLESRMSKKIKVILPVNLYGASADYDSLEKISNKYSVPLVEDCAQSHGARFNGKKTGTFGKLSCFSFYPTKNLGCYGDGGAIATNDKKLYKKLLKIRNYGQRKRYYHDIYGFNSRLDEIQAGVLNVKLRNLDSWNKRRKRIAGIYNKAFRNNRYIIPLVFHKKVDSVYHLYVVKVTQRAMLQRYLISKGIETLIHYPVPCHRQKVYSCIGYREGDFPIAEKVAKKILSLPMYPRLQDNEAEYIARTVKEFYEN